MARSQRYRHRVYIEQRADTQDDHAGGVTVSWDLFKANLWPCQIITGKGRELITAGAKHGDATALINMPYCDGLTTAHRIRWPETGQTFDIISLGFDKTGKAEHRLECSDLGDGD